MNEPAQQQRLPEQCPACGSERGYHSMKSNESGLPDHYAEYRCGTTGRFSTIGVRLDHRPACQIIASMRPVVEAAEAVAQASHVNTLPVGDFIDLKRAVRTMNEEPLK